MPHKDKTGYYFVGYLTDVQVEWPTKLYRAHKAPLITNNFTKNRAEIAAAACQSTFVVVSKGVGTGPITTTNRIHFPENCSVVLFKPQWKPTG